MSDLSITSDEHFMKQALVEAKNAFELDEVPIGAVVVCKDRIIARAHNLTERLTDVTAHAEMQAFTSASEYLDNKFLNDCTLYVTLEPCLMCAGAAHWTRIGRIVFGARDDRLGYMNLEQPVLHSKTQVLGGVMQDECAALLQDFFRKKRKNN